MNAPPNPRLFGIPNTICLLTHATNCRALQPDQPCQTSVQKCEQSRHRHEALMALMTHVVHSNARIGGTSSKPGPKESPRATNDGPSRSHDHPTSANQALEVSLPHSPSLSESIGMMPHVFENPQPLPLWLNPTHVKQIVRGNLMTLSVRPETIEPGEWVAHQGNDSLNRP